MTKYTDVDTLLNLHHNNHTTIRFSINSDNVIRKFEHRTPSFSERVKAAVKISESGYPLGFIIAPMFVYEEYKKDYLELLTTASERFKNTELQFEVISHRFTKRAKENITKYFGEHSINYII